MKQKLPLAQATIIAQSLMIDLQPFCTRLAIAGSIRRQKEEIGDIELVAIPELGYDMFGEPLPNGSALDMVDWTKFGKIVKNGPKYKQIALHEGINLDLFIVTPPAQWGVIFLIRTGPAEFSHRFVTSKSQGGLLPGYLKVRDGAIWSHNHIITTPEEQDVFDLAGLDYIEPEKRMAMWDVIR